jgi:hypothetical protein
LIFVLLTQANIQRQKVGKRLLNVQMGKDSQSTKRHILGKVDPTENCRTTVENVEVILADNSGDEIVTQKRKVPKKGKKKSLSSPQKWSDCGAVDHSKKSCHEPKNVFELEAKKRRRDDIIPTMGRFGTLATMMMMTIMTTLEIIALCRVVSARNNDRPKLTLALRDGLLLSVHDCFNEAASRPPVTGQW